MYSTLKSTYNISATVCLSLCFFHISTSDPPSAPRNVISSINETSVILDWSWPEDTGGRRDVTFTVVCKRCRTGGNGGGQRCEPCRSGVRFLPRATGLHNTTVTVGDLLAHTNYTFEIEAQNGVSSLAPKMRQYAAVTITTNQAGKTSQMMHAPSTPLSYVHAPNTCTATGPVRVHPRMLLSCLTTAMKLFATVVFIVCVLFFSV